jgi:hypothetical protein
MPSGNLVDQRNVNVLLLLLLLLLKSVLAKYI